MNHPQRRANLANVVTFNQAHNALLNTSDENIINNIDNNMPGVSRFYRNVVALQAHIMFSGVPRVSEFLDNYRHQYGDNSTQMLVNFPYFDPEFRESYTPLMCACLWSINAEMIRILYSYGADVSMSDHYGLFPEEHYYLPYYNHIANYTTNSNVNQMVYMRRMVNEFIHVRDEIEIISGERMAPENWQMPPRYINVDN